jgi:glycosyltransferase involved in cell wall biosynthesis/O-antigen ligase
MDNYKDSSLTESERKLSLIPLAGLLLYGFALPLSKSISSILMGLIYASGFFVIAFNKQFRMYVFRSLRQPLVLPIGIYIGMVSAGLLFSQDLKEGIGIVKQTANLLLVYVMTAVLLDTEQDAYNTEKHSQSLLFTLLIGIFMLDVIGMLTYGGVIGNRPHILPLMPLKMHHIWFGNLNAVGLYCAGTLLLASSQERWFSRPIVIWPYIVLSLVSIVLSQSRTAWLGMLCAGGVFLYFLVSKKRTFFLVFALIIAAYVSVYFSSQMVQERIDQAYKDIVLFVSGDPATSLGARFAMWSAAISMFLSNPVLGVGTGDYQFMVDVFVASGEFPAIIGKYNQPHNMYLWILATNGLLGVFAFFLIFYVIFRRSKRLLKGAGAQRFLGLLAVSVTVHYLIAGMTESLMNIHLLLSLYALLMGITIRRQAAVMSRNDSVITGTNTGDELFREKRHTGFQRMNVLHVVVNLSVGGVENTITRVISGYQKERFHPILCCIREEGMLAQTLLGQGYEVISLSRMKSRRFDFPAIAKLYKIIKEKNIRIVRTHQYHANVYGRIAAILAGVPCIVASVHNIYTRDRKLHRRLLNKFLSKFTDRIVAVSNAVKEDITRYDAISEDKITVIYNGIPLNEFNCSLPPQKAREILNLPQDITLIGSVGRLVEQKGHRYLIESASRIGESCIVIAGDGPIRKDLEEYARTLQVKTIFLGTIEPKIVPVFLRAIDIFCFPSVWEGFGIALVEAMSAGLPIVASDIPPHREVVADAGILVPSRNAEKMAESLTLLIQNQELRESLSLKAHHRAKVFSIEYTVRSYESLYGEILERKKSAGGENSVGNAFPDDVSMQNRK